MRRSLLFASAALFVALNACSGGGGGGNIPPFDVPAGVVVADFDGDGRDDVALAFAHVAGPPPHPGYVRVFRQSAAGVFDVPVDYAVGPDAYGLSAGRFDGDAHLDLVAASPGAAAQPNPADIGISILRQDAAAPGRFLPAQWVTTSGAAATDAAIAEHANGLADVVVSDGRSANGRALVLAQDPARPGELLSPVSLLAGSGRGSDDLAVGDLDGDTLSDVVLATQDGVALFYQQAGGGFSPVFMLAAGVRPSGVALADLDGDGRMDIVVANAGNAPAGGTGGASVTILRQTAAGSFVASHIAVADGARRVAIGDLNADGFPDIAVVSIVFQAIDRPSRVTVLLQSATSLGQFSVGTALDGPLSGNFIAIGDLNGDKLNDIVINDGPSVLLQNATMPGSFRPPAPLR
jgi:hypothetical protein